MDKNIETIDSDLFIVTENQRGGIITMRYKYIQDLIDDWYANLGMCPPKHSKVFLAVWNNHPINPHEYTDFESLMCILIGMTQ